MFLLDTCELNLGLNAEAAAECHAGALEDGEFASLNIEFDEIHRWEFDFVQSRNRNNNLLERIKTFNFGEVLHQI